ncbi:MAG: hypothetical protein ACI4J1_04730, partial [Ruminiclostridium sp.]
MKKLVKTVLSLFAAAVMASSAVVSAYADNNAAKKTNVVHTIYAEGAYYNWEGVSSAAQFVGSNGEFCFAYDDGDYVTVVRTKDGATLKKRIKLKKKHPIFGTVTCDSDGNYYLVTGETNKTDDKNKETVFISKYDKNGKHIKTVGDNGSSSLGYWYGDSYNTKIPFDGGSCRAAISGTTLAVNYAREMYSGHQSNSVFAVDIETMEKVSLGIYYNSHSFAQGIVPFGSDFVLASEGDAYPRAFTITKTKGNDNVSYNIFHFWIEQGATNDMYVVNDNFAHFGGIANINNEKVVLAGTSAKSLNSNAETETEQLFVQIFDPNKDLTNSDSYSTSGKRSGLSGFYGDLKVEDYGVKWLTKYSDKIRISNPQVVAADDKIVVLFEKKVDYEYKGVYYIVLDSDGKV